MSKTISFCLIMKDEERVLPACLDSIKGIASEIVIIDTGSSDRSIEIAKQYTDKVYSLQLDEMDFSKARNEALKYATSDYIFQIDADETLTAEGEKCLREILERPDRALYLVSIASQLDGCPDPALSNNYRLFPRDPEISYHFIVHENINNPGEDQDLGTPGKYEKRRKQGLLLMHSGYLNREKNRKGTDQRNIKLLERQILLTPDHPYFLYHLGRQYSGLGDWEKSISYYQKFLDYLKDHPENVHKVYTPVVMEGLLVSCMRSGKTDRMDEFRKVETINPGFYYNLGLWYDALGYEDIALLQFDRAIDNSKNVNKLTTYDQSHASWRPYLAKGEIYVSAKKYQRAIDCFKLALTESPHNTTIINLLARTYAIDMRPELAERFAILALKHEDSLNNRLHLADVQINFGKEDKGLETYFKDGSPEHLVLLRDALKESRKDLADRISKHLEDREYVKTAEIGKPSSSSVSVIIPTLLKCNREQFERSLEILSGSSFVKSIIILDNTETGEMSIHPKKLPDKISIFSGANRFVNPAWNYGMEICSTPYYLLLNDDVMVRPETISECCALMDQHPEIGIITYATEDKLPADYFQKAGGEILSVHVPLNQVSGGWFIFGRREDWTPIPEELKIFCGDNFIYDTIVLRKKKEIVKVLSNFVVHFTSTTIRALKTYETGALAEELATYEKIKKRLRY